MDDRLLALSTLSVAEFREGAGWHDLDGTVGELSLAAVAHALTRLGEGPAPQDAYDAAVLEAFENSARVTYGELQLHRSNPFLHLGNLDLSCYDRTYAPETDRAKARTQHLEQWPTAIQTAIETLDRVPAPVARAALPAAQGLAAGLDAGVAADRAGLHALQQLIDHLERVAKDGTEDVALGETALARLMGVGEALDVDLSALSAQADTERERLQDMLGEALGTLAPGRPVPEVMAELLADHPDPDGVVAEAQQMTEEVIAWTAEHDLAPWSDGDCQVRPAPESRRWAMAMMSWAAPYETDAPSSYYVTPPDASWPTDEQEQWLEVFSRTTLPTITVHEVAPGHFSHGRALRHLTSDVRRTLQSMSFAEGWAHYVEEVAVEEGFRAEDPRFAAGVALESLVRVTRLACAIGLHTGEMTVEQAAARFQADALYSGPAALSEARRGTFDPTYGRYTWGKLVILDLREKARTAWGADFSLPRFHRAMLSLGSPPLGLLDAALDQ